MENRQGVSRIFIFTGRYPFRVSISEDDGKTFSEFQKIGDFGGYFISTIVPLGPGRYMALFHDEGQFIRGGKDYKTAVYRSGTGTDMRTALYTYKSYDGGKTFHNAPVSYVHNPVDRSFENWELIYEAYQSKTFPDRHFELYSIFTEDGGLTWSQPNMICSHSSAKLCEPCAVLSPDGKEIAVFLRDNSRKHNSFVITSRDEGRTWSEPSQVCDGLTGDRHTAVYLPDGRLFVTFRDMKADSVLKGSWVAWVGSYEDAVSGKEGDCRLLIKRSSNTAGDCAYPGLELLADGTLLTTTYGKWDPQDKPYIVSVRIPKEALDQIPRAEKS
jgi:hypothetical protein